MSASSEIVERFMKQKDYDKQYTYHVKVAGLAEKVCKNILETQGIPAICTSRGKTFESVRAKLINRSEEKGEAKYEDIDAVYDDIVDLAGARIALFFPDQQDSVGLLIRSQFKVKEVKYPEQHKKMADENAVYKNRFFGYTAIHYRVSLKLNEGEAKAENLGPGSHRAEIQVMSVLQSAWAEVEHDIEYKKVIGPATRHEKRILDGLNGLVNTGEILLDQLHEVVKNRIRSEDKEFRDEYILGTFLHKWIYDKTGWEDVSLSSVDVLLKLLRVCHLDKPSTLEEKLMNINLSKNPNSPFMKMAQQYDPCEVKVPIYIMNHLLSAVKDKSPSAVPKDFEGKCRAMANAIIWLDVLFPRFTDWAPRVFGNTSRDQRNNLRWLMDTIQPIIILNREATLSDSDERNVNQLWEWFNDHEVEVVRFVFDLSKVGVQKEDSELITLLKRIFSSVKPWF